MSTFHVALIFLALVTVAAWVAGLGMFRTQVVVWREKGGSYDSPLPFNAGVVSGILLTVLLIIGGWLAIGPEYRLYRASVEKRILVEEARAQADAAVELAEAEVARATGTAEANEIVAGSITEPYLRYLYIDQLDRTSNQIIYLPTEAGLPILEADRFEQEPAE